MKPNCTYEASFYGKCTNPQPEQENRFGFCKKHIELMEFYVKMFPTVQAMWQEMVERAKKTQAQAPKLYVPGR